MTNLMSCCLILCISSAVFAQSNSTSIRYNFHIFNVDGALHFEQEKEVTTTVNSARGEFSGMVEFEPFQTPISRTTIRANRDLHGRALERWEDLESKDVFLDDARLHIWQLSNVLEGDVYTAGYWYESASVSWFPALYVPSVEGLQEFVIEVDVPISCAIEPHILFGVDSLNYTIERGPHSMSITFNDIPNLPDVPALSHRQPRACVLFQFKHPEKHINPITPRDFLLWYRQQFGYRYPSGEVSAKLPKFDLADTSGWQLVDSAFAFAQSQIRYIARADGLHSIVPSKPVDVAKRGWGDCKDRAFLMQAMCQHNSVQVYPVLVHTTRKKHFKDLVHVSMYNHVIVAIVDGVDTVYADPTNPYADIGTLTSSLYGSSALFLDVSAPRIVTLGVLARKEGLNIATSLKRDSVQFGSTTITASSYHGFELRALLENTGEADQISALSKYVQRLFRNIEISEIASIVDDGQTITIECTVDASRFLIQGSERTYAPSMPYNVVAPTLQVRASDSLPLHFEGVFDASLVLEVEGSAQFVGPEFNEVSGNHFGFDVCVQSSEIQPTCQKIVYRAYRGVESFEGLDKREYLSTMKELAASRNKLIEIEW